MDILVRKIRKQDRATWLELRRKLWPGRKDMHLKDMQDLFGRRGFICLIAWAGKQPIGFSEAMIRPFANGCNDRPVAFLEGLWVEPKYRRQNVGRRLVQAVEAWAIRKGFRELGSDAYLTARESHKAHRAYGFRETERVVYFRKRLPSA